jgi:hypothetical protein
LALSDFHLEDLSDPLFQGLVVRGDTQLDQLLDLWVTSQLCLFHVTK